MLLKHRQLTRKALLRETMHFGLGCIYLLHLYLFYEVDSFCNLILIQDNFLWSINSTPEFTCVLQ